MITRTHFSIGQAFTKPEKLVKKAAEMKLPAVFIIDHQSLAGVYEFTKAASKYKIKAVIGCEFSVAIEENTINLIAIAKNLNGYKNIVRILGRSQLHFKTKKPCVPLFAVNSFTDDVVFFSEKAVGIGEIVVESLEYCNYLDASDEISYHLIICNSLNCSLDDLPVEYKNDFSFNGYPDFMLKISESCENYDITKPPHLPNFGVEDPDECLKSLCRNGWISHEINSKPIEIRNDYVSRIQSELRIFEKYNLSTYMLVIWDVMRFAKEKGILTGLRGSASGCLVSYLCGISDIDPVWPDKTIPYDPAKSLVFERFINEGRLSEDRISLPDIDCDIEAFRRQEILDYVSEKYGRDRVAHIVTFSRIKAKDAVKLVFRAFNQPGHFSIANNITANMVDEAKVQDILQDLIEENEDYNILDYNLDYVDQVKSYFKEYEYELNMARKLVNTIDAQSKHAAGIVVSKDSLRDFIPLLIDAKTGEHVVGMEMESCEACGGVKYDFLGVLALDKMSKIWEMISSGSNTFKI